MLAKFLGASHAGSGLARLTELAHLKTLHCSRFWRIKNLEMDQVTSKKYFQLG